MGGRHTGWEGGGCVCARGRVMFSERTLWPKTLASCVLYVYACVCMCDLYLCVRVHVCDLHMCLCVCMSVSLYGWSGGWPIRR